MEYPLCDTHMYEVMQHTGVHLSIGEAWHCGRIGGGGGVSDGRGGGKGFESRCRVDTDSEVLVQLLLGGWEA